MSDDEGDVIENLHAVNCLADSVYRQYFVTDLSVRTEIDVWVLTAGRTDVIQLDFLQRTLTGSCLL